ncbi:Kelch repeat-containing protein [Dyadobacter psychrotolerans]|uniref:Galactose oxidase n=1 Tax=Dyadobacter psychrotolerans TaxID=2541721 RepID=A0A4R5DA40_9BACT|nr:kelch repeat-containing protein [Dyadobacter psychrotolerans]TDE10492.1 galactose oxidase [Dyadobacter psychrotolerans]
MFNTLKKTSLALLVASTALLQFSCNNDDVEADKVGNWYKAGLPSFGGSARSRAVSFSIGSKGYIGTGSTSETVSRVKDFWAYDVSTKIWSQIADYTGTGRHDAVAFVISGKAYVGTGYDGNTLVDNGYKKDFYQYDPATNLWKKVADFAGTRNNASAFVVNGKGYVGLGYNGTNFYQDFYSYDPATDKWAEVATFTGGKRRGANSFVIDGKAYVGFGQNNSTANTKDLYQFDPAGNSGLGSWNKMVDTGDTWTDLTARAFGFTLVINNKAYIVGGTGLSDVWEYAPTTNTWTAMTPFESGSARSYAAGFSFGDIGFIGTGVSGSINVDDFWAFDPTSPVNADDNN